MEEQILELQIKVSYLERDVRVLDELVRTLADRSEKMERELAELRERTEPASVMGGLVEEVPPHSVRL